MKRRTTVAAFVCFITSSILYSSDEKNCLNRLLPNTYEHDQNNGVLIGKYTAFIGSDDNHNRSCAWQKILDHNPWRVWDYNGSELTIHKLYCLWRTYEVRAYLPKQAQQQQKKDDSNETKQ